MKRIVAVAVTFRTQALSGDGPCHSLHASAWYCDYNEDLFFVCRDREMRLSARNAAQQEAVTELQKKIQLKVE